MTKRRPNLRAVNPSDLPEEVQDTVVSLSRMLSMIGTTCATKLEEQGAKKELSNALVSAFLMRAAAVFTLEGAPAGDELRAAFTAMAEAYYDEIAPMRAVWEAEQERQTATVQ